MWYVIWTTTGCEQKLGHWIRDYVPAEYYDDCFVPLIDQNKKVNGDWGLGIGPNTQSPFLGNQII